MKQKRGETVQTSFYEWKLTRYRLFPNGGTNSEHAAAAGFQSKQEASPEQRADGVKLMRRPLKAVRFVFLRLLLRCIVIIDQMLIAACRGGGVSKRLWPRRAFGAAAAKHNVHLAFCAFCADLVTLPLVGAFFSTPLITPTATVCRMSRTAKRPEEEENKLYTQSRS